MAGEERFALFLRTNGASTKWVLVASLLVLTARSEGAEEGSRVVCYHTNWAAYRPGAASFTPQNINPHLCTHLIYAFGNFADNNTLIALDKLQDIDNGGFAKFTALKTLNNNLKTILAIGGGNEGSKRFGLLAASAERGKDLALNAVKFLRENNFDGLDLDWQFPASRDGGRPKDKGNYANLVQELRLEFDTESRATGRPRLLLTMAMPSKIDIIDRGYDIPKLNQYLDWMNVLCYDYHQAPEPADHHSALYALEASSEYNQDKKLNIDFTIKHLIRAGAERDKLVVGIPTYGRTFTLSDPESTDIGAPTAGPGEPGNATRDRGTLAYFEICEQLMLGTRASSQASDEVGEEDRDEDKAEVWTVVRPDFRAMGPYAYKGNQWVGYDDEISVKRKAEYVAEERLGGVMFWTIDKDDFQGKCHGKAYPLIEAAKEALYKRLGLTDDLPSREADSSRKRPSSAKPSKPSDEDNDVYKNSISNNRKASRVTAAELQLENEPTTNTMRTSTATATTPDWQLNTPEPPTTTASGLNTSESRTTPNAGTEFKCEEPGMFSHPSDCKKFFWCLDGGPSNPEIFAQEMMCPTGWHFDKSASTCVYSPDMVCDSEKAATTTATTASFRPPSSLAALPSTRPTFPRITTTPVSVEEEREDPVKDKTFSKEDLLDLINKLGGVQQLQKLLLNTGQKSQVKGAPAPANPGSREPQQETTRRQRPPIIELSSESEDDIKKSTKTPSTSFPTPQSFVTAPPKNVTATLLETTIYNQNDTSDAYDVDVKIALTFSIKKNKN